jgi:hypothetical protein
MNNEMKKDMEENNYGLICSTVLTFAYRDLQKTMKNLESGQLSTG